MSGYYANIKNLSEDNPRLTRLCNALDVACKYLELSPENIQGDRDIKKILIDYILKIDISCEEKRILLAKIGKEYITELTEESLAIRLNSDHLADLVLLILEKIIGKKNNEANELKDDMEQKSISIWTQLKNIWIWLKNLIIDERKEYEIAENAHEKTKTNEKLVELTRSRERRLSGYIKLATNTLSRMALFWIVFILFMKIFIFILEGFPSYSKIEGFPLLEIIVAIRNVFHEPMVGDIAIASILLILISCLISYCWRKAPKKPKKKEKTN